MLKPQVARQMIGVLRTRMAEVRQIVGELKTNARAPCICARYAALEPGDRDKDETCGACQAREALTYGRESG